MNILYIALKHEVIAIYPAALCLHRRFIFDNLSGDEA